MRFLIIGHSKHKRHGNKIMAYEPYIREMNIWLKHVDEVEIIAPLIEEEPTNIDAPYIHHDIKMTVIPKLEFTSVKNSFRSILKLPLLLYKISKACRQSDHIHLRCPGNIGLLGCLVQIVYPSKIKTAKYAGNWDLNAKQPFSYNLQKYILRNTFLTKNIKVLVYGRWPNQSKNIWPFFTASFFEKDKIELNNRDYKDELSFIYVGSLVPGKRPRLVIEIVDALLKKGFSCKLEILGDGPLIQELKEFVNRQDLKSVVSFHGNVRRNELIKFLAKAHFLVLPSRSEGWPKAIAEAMFYGVIPIATKVSCIPEMLNYGERGMLIDSNLNSAVEIITHNLSSNRLQTMSDQALKWSQKYTLEKFEDEIKGLLR